MGEIRCFWTVPTDRVTRSLRRFVHSDDGTCSGKYGYHNADARIDDAVVELGPDGSERVARVEPFTGDTRWPTQCECGYQFTKDDQRQVFTVRIYRANDGREWPMRELPPGAMYDATWYHDMPNMVGPDGVALVVCLPPAGTDNWWHVDGHAVNNPAPQGWTRSGTVADQNPNVTASPSILTPRYHGWLRNGVLVEC